MRRAYSAAAATVLGKLMRAADTAARSPRHAASMEGSQAVGEGTSAGFTSHTAAKSGRRADAAIWRAAHRTRTAASPNTVFTSRRTVRSPRVRRRRPSTSRMVASGTPSVTAARLRRGRARPASGTWGAPVAGSPGQKPWSRGWRM
jgi:hypothetical protein